MDYAFKEANKWIGIKMKINDIRKFAYCDDKKVDDNTLLFAHRFDDTRQEAVKAKIEIFMWIHTQQIDIEEYYFTNKGGPIAWVKMDPRLVKEIHRRAQIGSSKDFQTSIFIPKIARARKACVDRLLLDFKKVNPDFRYIVKNGDQDINVLIKRYSERTHCPYGAINLEMLGAISPIKPFTRKNSPEEPEDGHMDDEGFICVKSLQRMNFIEKNQIFQNLKDFLDGFESVRSDVNVLV